MLDAIRHTLAALTATLLLAPLVAAHAAESKPVQPNIIFILADDYGIPGVGCYGGRFNTPHLDALAGYPGRGRSV